MFWSSPTSPSAPTSSSTTAIRRRGNRRQWLGRFSTDTKPYTNTNPESDADTFPDSNSEPCTNADSGAVTITITKPYTNPDSSTNAGSDPITGPVHNSISSGDNCGGYARVQPS